jgi:type III pantothenate kinase
MLLAIDVGNTHITVGAFQGKRLAHAWRLHTHRHYTADELGVQFLNLLATQGLAASDLTGACVASVVPSLDEPLETACRRYLHQAPLVVNTKIKLGITNRYKKPEEVGADRLVNAVAAHALYRKAVIVVDFGTATTLDCVSVNGDYLGGAICPGLESAGEWLATHTAKLPHVAFRSAPTHAMGRTTKESLQSGLFYGYIGLVEGLLKRLAQEMEARPVVVVTGGLASLMGPHLSWPSEINPNLTLEGLCLIWDQNQ